MTGRPWSEIRTDTARQVTGHGPDCAGCADPVFHHWIAHVVHRLPVVVVEPEFTGTLF